MDDMTKNSTTEQKKETTVVPVKVKKERKTRTSKFDNPKYIKDHEAKFLAFFGVD